MTEIEQLLHRQISAQGPISFARFMEAALYCPKIGYYEQDSRLIGLAGDFYTSASIGPLFGQLLGAQFAGWSAQLVAGPLTWIEAGAHNGTLASAILEWLGKNRPELQQRLTYTIIEPSMRRRTWQAEKLKAYGKRVRWFSTISELGEQRVNGIIFSNELLDAFPVHRLVWNRSSQQWSERGVGLEQNRFVWKALKQPSFNIEAQLDQSGFALGSDLLNVLPDGFIIDVSPAAAHWWTEAAEALLSGKLLTIDYGATSDELMRPERTQGTMRAYYRQRISDDILAQAGEQDITAHVNFTQLERAGEAAGLKTEIFASQERFLSKIVQTMLDPAIIARWTTAETRQLHTLTHPEHLGARFRVLVQGK